MGNNNVVKKPVRDSRFELLRIFAIIMIVFNHFSSHGVLKVGTGEQYVMWNAGPTFNRLLTMWFSPGGRVGVGIFFMLSGYFMITSTKARKVSKLIAQAIFFAFFCAIVSLVFHFFLGNPSGLNLQTLALRIFRSVTGPVSSSAWWYITVYILIVFASPLLNKYVGTLSKKKYIFVLLYFWIFAYGFGVFNGVTFSDLSKGLFFYFLGGYVKLFVKPNKGATAQIIRLCVAGLFWTLTAGMGYFAAADKYKPMITALVGMVLPYIQAFLFVPICALALFLFFNDFRIKPSALINRIASAVFGIYLFHDSNLTRGIIWNLAKVDKQFDSGAFIITAVLTCFAVLFVSFMVEWFSRLIVPLIERLINKIFDYLFKDAANSAKA